MIQKLIQIIKMKAFERDVEKLIQKAMNEIPRMPIRTAGIEHHYVEVPTTFYCHDLFILFDCNPPNDEDSPNLNKMMVSCVIAKPKLRLTVERPLIYDTVPFILEKLKEDAFREQIKETFIQILDDEALK